MPLSFRDDIRPLFRDVPDVACMARRGVKLDDAAWMCDPLNAQKVCAAVASQRMPPDAPWPPSRVELLNRWINEGCHP